MKKLLTLARAYLLERQGQWSQAARLYQNIVEATQDKSGHFVFRQGLMAEKQKDWPSAQACYQQAADKRPGDANVFYHLGFAASYAKNYPLAISALEHSLQLKANNPYALRHLGRALIYSGKPTEGEARLYQALDLLPGNAMLWDDLLKAVRKQGRTWQEVEVLQKQIELLGAKAQTLHELACALQTMGRFSEAGQTFAQANKKQTGNALWLYHEGHAWEQAGDKQKAQQAYAKAIQADTKLEASRLGIGVFHQQADLWQQAMAAYADSLQKEPATAELHYRLGLASARCYQWQQAIGHYQQALALAPHHAHWHYQLGFAHERLGQLEQAAQHYQAAVMRSNNQNSNWHYRLGTVLGRLGQHEQACVAFAGGQQFKQPHGLDTRGYQQDTFIRLAAEYVEFQQEPVLESSILYECQAGKAINCNPYAIYRQLQKDPRFAGFTHIWVVTEHTTTDEKTRAENTLYVTRGSRLYLKYLARAKYLINNNTFPPYFVRRAGQQYLNTWHGTPLKSLGKQIKGGFMEHANATRNFLQTTHILSPNRHTSQVLLEDYSIKGLYTGQLAETGYPRIDQTLEPNQGPDVREQLGIAQNERVILYAPTWRGTLNDVQFDARQLIDDLSAIQTKGARLLFRGHHMQENQLNGLELPGLEVIVVPEHIDTNALLAAVDILITDYSSIFFDFLPLERPVIYYAHDLEQYQHERGLSLDISTLPGQLCYNREQLAHCVQQQLAQPQLAGDLKQARNSFYPHEDGQASRRAVEFFFFNNTSQLHAAPAEQRKKLLFYQGNFIPNGITSSFLSLVHQLDPAVYDITVVVEPQAIANNQERLERFSQLPEHVRVIPRMGATLLSVEERWISEQFDATGVFSQPEQARIHEQAYAREYRRVFGESTFDVVINFEGYVRFWVYTLSAATGNCKKIIYLHNDMRNEEKERFPYLKSVFPYYVKYDVLACVSPGVWQENRSGLASEYGIPDERFVTVNNMVDVEGIRSKAKQPLEPGLQARADAAGKLFVTLGRLSPEKDHEKLINAFSQVARQHKDACLMIVGEGPLRDELGKQIQQLKLENNVLITGLLANPFPLLARADCFVFSSNYEGQGLVILEALILDIPVISTDVVGPRSLLENGEGLLVANHADALAEAMLEFIRNGLAPGTFNHNSYTTHALNSFARIVAQGYDGTL